MIAHRNLIRAHLLAAAAAVAIGPSLAQADVLVNSVDGLGVLRYDQGSGAYLGVFAAGGVDYVQSICIGPDGNLYASSNAANEVLRYSGTTGAFMNVFASGNGLDGPAGVAFGPDGRLYVVGNRSGQVLRYNSDGTYHDLFASGISAPEGITYGPDGKWYVVSNAGHEVKRFTASGVADGTIGSGHLSSPHTAVFGNDTTGDGHAEFYVSSHEYYGLVEFNGATGTFIRELVPSASGDLGLLQGATFGPDGSFWLCSQSGNSIKRYDGMSGAYFGDVISAGSGGLNMPGRVIFHTPANEPRWDHDGSGTWSTVANWRLGVPNGIGASANFTDGTTAACTVTVDAPYTVSAMKFNNDNGYTIAGNSALTLDAVGGNAAIAVLHGSHSISAPLVLAKTTTVTPVNGTTLAVSGGISGSMGLVKEGAGVFALSGANTYAGPTQVAAGTLRMMGGSISGTSGIENNATISGSGLIGGSGMFNNAGTLQAKSGSLVVTSAALTNTGILKNAVGASLFIESPGLSNQGNIQVNAGGAVVFDAPLDIPEAKWVSIHGGALASPSISNAGLVDGYGQITGNLTNGASVHFYGATTVEGNLVNQSSGVVTVENAQTLITGSLTNTGTLIVGPGGRLVSAEIAGGGSATTAVGAGASLLTSSVDQGVLDVVGTPERPARVAVRPKAFGGQITWLTQLTVANGSLDLNDNDLVVEYGSGPNPLTNLRELVFAGYRDHADTAATGIVSGTSQTDGGKEILALLDNALIGATEWPPGLGQPVSGNAVIGKYTYFGDANLDGQVTADDYALLDANLNTSPALGRAWLDGDANLDGSVTPDDYAILDSFLGSGVGNPLGAGVVAVPEPAALTLLASGLLLRRRRTL